VGLDDWANIATIAGFPIAAVALIYAGYQTRLSRRASSASAAISISEAFRDAWQAFVAAPAEHKTRAFGDLVNLIEATCTIRADGLLVGHSRKMLDDYVSRILARIDGSQEARDLFGKFLEDETTFEQIRRFMAEMKR
jgi:hypothetical protein